MASGFSNIIWKEDEKEEENCNFLLHQLVFFFLDFFSQRFLAKAVVVLVAALERQLTAAFFSSSLKKETTKKKKERQSFSKMQKTGKVDIIVSSIILHRTSFTRLPSQVYAFWDRNSCSRRRCYFCDIKLCMRISGHFKKRIAIAKLYTVFENHTKSLILQH